MRYASLIEPLKSLVREADAILLRHYGREEIVAVRKEDHSPVTEADCEANAYIVQLLNVLAPDIPVISEEGENFPVREQASGNRGQEKKAEVSSLNPNTRSPAPDRFFLVDPLDGTRSFIRRDGQFTVNIGLVENGIPVLGFVSIPVQDAIYYTGADGKAYRQRGNAAPQHIRARAQPEDGLTVLASSSHRTKATDDFIARLTVKECRPASSSLKFCLIAEGKADVYPRFGPTQLWDTAAGQAVLLAAGGRVEKEDGSPLSYPFPRSEAELRNPHFIAWGKRA